MAEFPHDDEDGLLNGQPTAGDRATFLGLVVISVIITLGFLTVLAYRLLS